MTKGAQDGNVIDNSLGRQETVCAHFSSMAVSSCLSPATATRRLRVLAPPSAVPDAPLQGRGRLRETHLLLRAQARGAPRRQPLRGLRRDAAHRVVAALLAAQRPPHGGGMLNPAWPSSPASRLKNALAGRERDFDLELLALDQ